MTWYFPSSSAQAGTVVSMTSTDGVHVVKQVYIHSTGDNTINATGTNITATIEGTVIASNVGSAAIRMGSTVAVDHDHSLTITKDGLVMAGNLAVGINILGYQSTVNNAGTINAHEGIAILIRGTNASTESTIINTGRIEGEVGICHYNTVASSETLVVKNSGIIDAETAFDKFLSTTPEGRELITNTGTINGIIYLFNGDDRYVGTKGKVTSLVDGGAGDDILTGGQEDNTFTGGNDDDRLTGNGGEDILTGGLGADLFIYRSASDSRGVLAALDHITDFSRAQGDRISLRAIDADPTEAGNQGFDFIGQFTFSGVAGQLRYDRLGSETVIAGDIDGDGTADFRIRLDSPLTLQASDFLL